MRLAQCLRKLGGADGIEVHAVHEGYLLDNFTMEMFNQRNDEFGKGYDGQTSFPTGYFKSCKESLWRRFSCHLRFSLKSFIRSERHGIFTW